MWSFNSKITYTGLFLFLWSMNGLGLFCFALLKDTPFESVNTHDDTGKKEDSRELPHKLIRKEEKLSPRIEVKGNDALPITNQNSKEKNELLLVQSKTLYGTLPYLDENHSEIQSIPGALNFAFYDVGGEGKAYHSNSEENFGSCGLNPCDIVQIRNGLKSDPHDVNGDGVSFDEKDVHYLHYLNSLRSDESASVSYTKWAVGDWSGDRYAGSDTQMIPYIPYWGWLPMGEWVRVTFDVKQAGLYSADLTATCNSGGYISVRIDKAIQISLRETDDKFSPYGYITSKNNAPSSESDTTTDSRDQQEKRRIEFIKKEIQREQGIGKTEEDEIDSGSEMFIDEIIGPIEDEAPIFNESHIRVPSSGHYHQWQLYESILKDVEFPSTGLYIITVTIESFDSYPNGQFGNMMQIDFSPQN